MANFFQLDVLTLKGSLFSGKVYFSVFPAVRGPIGVYAGHAAFLTRVLSGLLRIYTSEFVGVEPSKPDESIVVSGGVLEVLPTSVVLLADVALRTDEIDEEHVLEAQLVAKRKEVSEVADDERARMMQEIALVQAQMAALKHLRRR